MIGLRELLIIGMVVVVLYGRSGVLKGDRAQTILPWLSPIRRTHYRRASPGRKASEGSQASTRKPTSRIPGAFLMRGNRLYWALTILAATAIAAWIITRTLITSGTSASAGALSDRRLYLIHPWYEKPRSADHALDRSLELTRCVART